MLFSLRYTSSPSALIVASAACIFGLAGLFVKTIEVSPLVLAGFRTLVPILCLALFEHQLLRRIDFKKRKALLFASALTAFRILLWVLGFLYSDMGKAVVILYLWPILYVSFEHVFNRAPLSMDTLMLLGLCFVGISIMYSQEPLNFSNENIIGMLLMFCVACLNAVNMVIFKQQLSTVSSQEVLFFDNLVGALVFSPFIVVYANQLDSASLPASLAYGFVIGFLSYQLFYLGLSKLKGSTAAIICHLEVVVASLIGVTFFGESLGLNFFIGASLILFASFYAKNLMTKGVRA